ncbi:hypothetical protein NHQ30_004044 [Ciborinia camelliae]|nr:hypothetical protein NHQ30_004044 [Ciborinia camelliae]
MTDPKLGPFNLHTISYKTIHGFSIPAHILIPKSIASNPEAGKYPVLVRFHGGFLVTGSALFTEWLSPWVINLVTSNSAILIMPDYRLLPEATGQEILDDLRDFWAWFEGTGAHGLSHYLASVNGNLNVDFDKVTVFGESAGGYLAIRSSLLPFSYKASEGENVSGVGFEGPKAVIAAYPMTMLRGKWYSEASGTKSPFGFPQLDEGILDTHMEGSMGNVVMSADPPARLDIAVAMVQRGRWTGIFERAGAEGLWLEDVIGEEGKGMGKGERKSPYLFAFHGMADTAVPWEDTREWVGIWGKRFGRDRVRAVWRVGMEHGFDGEVDEESGEGRWLKEGLEEVRREWLGN